MLPVDEVFESDVLIIGLGGAGAIAALYANDVGASVTVVCRGLAGKDSCGGEFFTVCGYTDPNDNWRALFNDMIRSGCFLNNQRLVEAYCKENVDCAVDLERLGVIFERTQDGSRHQQVRYGGHTYIRSSILNGNYMVRIIIDEIKRRRSIEIVDETLVTKLLTFDGRVVGAVGLNIPTGDLYVFKARSVVLATGGAARLWNRSVCPAPKVGAGMYLAYEVGAELIDMEFTQFHPTSCIPIDKGGYPEAYRGFGARLYNALGERFMRRYSPKWLDLATRDFISKCIFREVQEGRGTPKGGVYISLSHVDPDIIDRYMRVFANSVKQLQGIDIYTEAVEVMPHAHYSMGGIRVGLKGETNIPGLYAVGEVTGGLHGANRLGSNSLPAVIWEGKHGKYAGEAALLAPRPVIDVKQVENERERIYGLLNKDGTVSPYELVDRLQNIMWNFVGIERSEEGLKRALEEFERIEKEYSNVYLNDHSDRYNRDLMSALEIPWRITLGRIMAKAALMRTESRGAHMRKDYPKMDNDNWLCNIVVRKNGKEISLEKVPVEEYIMTKEEWLALGYYGDLE